MLRPTYVDLYPDYDAGTGYMNTNEEPELFASLLEKEFPDTQFQLGGGIASGGEISFFVLLPRCDEVVVVDHSYTSLRAFYLKACLLVDRGVKGFREVLRAADWDAKIDSAWQESVRVFPKSRYGIDRFSSNLQAAWRAEWDRVSDATLEVALSRLDKLTLCHGDLTDLAKLGKFDLLYLSNAMEHVSRVTYPGRKDSYACNAPRLTSVEPLMRQGGIVLYTGLDYTTESRYNEKLGRYESVPRPDLCANWSSAVDGGYAKSWNHQMRRYQPVAQFTEVAS